MSRIIPNENSWISFVANTSSTALAAPVETAPATAATGGTLAAGTYFYVVTATNAAGETVRSNELSQVAAGATSTVTVNWGLVTGATGYKVYRGTAAGAENALVGTVGAVATFIDTGAAGTAATPPASNSTGQSLSGIANLAAPKLATELNSAVDLTGFLIQITASTTGNIVPVPTLKNRFETTIPGTVGASFSADFYRDDANDLAWATLPRGARGNVVISRLGGKSATVLGMVIAGDTVEVWPVTVTSRSAAGMTSNTAEMFTVTCTVPTVPVENAIVAA